MIGKKINQLATELAPVSTDLTIIGDPISGVSKKITLAQLGAIFSGAVSFYDDLASFPATGDINVIYCAKDTKKLYLWSGSAYVEVFPSQALLDTYQLRSEKGNANGYASLDSGGKVPVSQLPSSIMEYKGMWNAATNTPTLANGTGDTGDVYICNVAGTVNFGAGPLTFAVGDYVIYSGSIWQRSSGAVGTVTSVAASITGDAIGITGSPVTTSGTLALAFSGTSAQYINGAGNLINFPTSLVTGTGTIYSLTKWGFTSGNIINSNLFDTGSVIYNNNATAGAFAVQFNGNTTTGLSYGLLINAGTNASDIALRVQNASSTSEYFFVYGDGKVQINNIPNATTDTDRFIVSDNGVIKYRTGAELLSDIGGASASGYVPYTGATTNLDLGTHTLSAKDLVINHSSGSGVAASITKGGAGEALTVVKSSGSGNAASITGGVTLLDELHLNTDLADAYIASASNWNDAYNLRHNAVTLGTANGLSLSTQVLSLALASGSTTGALSSTDWTTFNNKQSALTNPVTGTGTTNYLPKFTGTSTIGDSVIQESSSLIGIGMTPVSGYKLNVSGLQRNQGANTTLNFGELDANNIYFQALNLAGDTSKGFVWYGTGELMRLNASGNLSIGNTNDTYKLDVSGTGRFSLASTGSGAVLNIGNVGSGVFGGLAISDGGTYPMKIWGSELQFLTGSSVFSSATTRLTIASTGAATLSSAGSVIPLKILNTTGTTLDMLVLETGWNNPSGNKNIIWKDATNTLGRISVSYDAGTGSTMRFGSLYNGGYQTSDLLTIASTGSATFSSSVTAGGIVNSPTYFFRSINPATESGIETTIIATGNGENIRAGIFATNNYAADVSTSLIFKTNGSSGSATERMRITSGGNVGIGTTSPYAKFQVFSTATSPSLTVGTAAAAIISCAEGQELAITANGTAPYGIAFQGRNNNGGGPSGTSYPIIFNPLGGNVGIGTTSPAAVLEVAGTSSTSDFRISRTVSPSTYFYISAPGGSPSTATMGINGVGVMALNASGSVGIGTTSPSNLLHLYGTDGNSYLRWTSDVATTGARIGYNGTEFRIDQQQNADITFRTNGSERLRITSGGNVGIGNTAPQGKFEVGIVNANSTYGGLFFSTFTIPVDTWYTVFTAPSNDQWNAITEFSWTSSGDYNRSGAAYMRWAYDSGAATLGVVYTLFNNSQNATASFRKSGNEIQVYITGGAANYYVQVKIQGSKAQ